MRQMYRCCYQPFGLGQTGFSLTTRTTSPMKSRSERNSTSGHLPISSEPLRKASRDLSHLKKHLQRKLHDSRGLNRRDFSEVWAASVDDRVIGLHRVRHVEGFGPNFEPPQFSQREASRERRIEAPVIHTPNRKLTE